LTKDEKEKFVEINKTVEGETGEPVVLNDLATGKYDIKVKVGPSHTTAKAEAADGMLQFVQAVPAAAPVIGDLLAKTQDWPDAEVISARLKAMMPPPIAGLEIDKDGNPVPPPKPNPEQEAKQKQAEAMAEAAAMAEVNEKIAKAEKVKHEATGAEADAMLKQLTAAEKRLRLEFELGHALTAQEIAEYAEPDEGEEQGEMPSLEPEQTVGGESTLPPAPMPVSEAPMPDNGPLEFADDRQPLEFAALPVEAPEVMPPQGV
jgi:hypothetical protein